MIERAMYSAWKSVDSSRYNSGHITDHESHYISDTLCNVGYQTGRHSSDVKDWDLNQVTKITPR